MTLLHDCCFCSADSDSSCEAPWNLTLLEDRWHRVMPTKGALIAGWVLVVPRDHGLCMGAMPKERRQLLWEAALRVADRISARFGSATIFEHGPADGGRFAGCGVDHTHIHVAPLDFSLTSAAIRIRSSLTWQVLQEPPGDSAARIHSSGLDYLLVKEPSHDPVFVLPAPEIRQFLRKAIAVAIGRPDEWDYNQNALPETALATAKLWA